MSLLRNVLLKWCSSFQFEITFRKIQIIIDIENWLYKSEFCKLPRTRNSLSQYGHNRPIWIKVRSWWQVLPQHQSTYLRGPESPLLKFPFQTKTYLVKVSINVSADLEKTRGQKCSTGQRWGGSGGRGGSVKRRECEEGGSLKRGECEEGG